MLGDPAWSALCGGGVLGDARASASVIDGRASADSVRRHLGSEQDPHDSLRDPWPVSGVAIRHFLCFLPLRGAGGFDFLRYIWGGEGPFDKGMFDENATTAKGNVMVPATGQVWPEAIGK